VTKRSRPDLEWKQPRRFAISYELIQSDAFRSLTKHETDIFLYALSERQYPGRMKRKKGREIDYWNPLNGRRFLLPYNSIQKFFGKRRVKAPSENTIARAMKKLMHVGFVSLVKAGGNGKGDMNIYRLEHNWRIWKKDDPACFTSAGMAKGRGYCVSGSGEFYPDANF